MRLRFRDGDVPEDVVEAVKQVVWEFCESRPFLKPLGERTIRVLFRQVMFASRETRAGHAMASESDGTNTLSLYLYWWRRAGEIHINCWPCHTDFQSGIVVDPWKSPHLYWYAMRTVVPDRAKRYTQLIDRRVRRALHPRLRAMLPEGILVCRPDKRWRGKSLVLLHSISESFSYVDLYVVSTPFRVFVSGAYPRTESEIARKLRVSEEFVFALMETDPDDPNLEAMWVMEKLKMLRR